MSTETSNDRPRLLKLKPWQRRWINKQLKHGEKMTRAERGAETLRLAKQITSKGYQ